MLLKCENLKIDIPMTTVQTTQTASTIRAAMINQLAVNY